jgi:hypothetical protein
MSDGADQPPEQTTPAGEPSNDTGNALVVTGPFFQRTDWLSFGVTVILVLVVYLCTLAPEVTLRYSGIVSTSAKYGGVAYPPGFPVWTVYSWLFANLLPFSNVAWRVAVGSAVATALACGLVALMVSRAGAMLLENTPAFTCRSTTEQHLLRSVCGGQAGRLGLALLIRNLDAGARKLARRDVRLAGTCIQTGLVALLGKAHSLVLGQRRLGLRHGNIDLTIRHVNVVIGNLRIRLRLLGNAHGELSVLHRDWSTRRQIRIGLQLGQSGARGLSPGRLDRGSRAGRQQQRGQGCRDERLALNGDVVG